MLFKLLNIVAIGLLSGSALAQNEFSSSKAKTFAPAAELFLNKCNSQMSQQQYLELLTLSDVSTFSDYKMAAPRAQRIAEIFAEAKDRRGIFASMYVAITNESVGSSARGEYQDNVMASELVKRFAERYFEPLHNYLLNGAANRVSGGESHEVVGEWQEYYDLAEDCQTSDLRILGTGVNNHMTMDLPYALSEIGAPKSFYDDFMKFGNILILKKRESTNLLISQQNVYAASFFDLFFVGTFVDSFLPKGTAATIGFQMIRAEAWTDGVWLQSANRKLNEVARFGIRASWSARQALLTIMPYSDPTMKGTEE